MTSRVGQAYSRLRRFAVRKIEDKVGMVAAIKRRPQNGHIGLSPVTAALFDRLSTSDLDSLSSRLSDAERSHWASKAPGSIDWKRCAVHYCVHYGVAGAIERMGLSAAVPPAEIHSMARGALAAGGSLYHADLVMGAIEEAALTLPGAASVLDFGCSSGRVIRVVKAYRPDLQCAGCDPNDAAIRWAQAAIPDIRFFTNGQRPPLPLADDSLDCAFAVSVWSHFGPNAALSWLEEMRRVLKAGGLLVLTTHGFQSVALYARENMRATEDMRRVLGRLLYSCFDYAPHFSEDGDWGVVDREWGEAYISPEWLLNHVTPHWEMRLYRSGANENNQDLAILRKPEAARTETVAKVEADQR